MRPLGQILKFPPAAGVAWRPATSATDMAAPNVRTLRHRVRHSTARRTAACLFFGHEKWTALSGDWTCMRCGKVKCLEVPIRSETSALPKFGG